MSIYNVYRIFNTSNGKEYFGSSLNAKRRIQRHLSGNGSRIISEDLQNFNKEVFVGQIIYDAMAKHEAHRLVQHHIVKQQTLYPMGYNLTIGGAGSHGGMWSNKQKKAIQGTKNGRSVLSEKQVVDIFYDKRTRIEIATQYNITKTMVTKIRTSQAWNSVTDKLRSS